MTRKYVTKAQVSDGLCRPWDEWMECWPGVYLRELRERTGLSWAKLAHDLSVDSGCEVSMQTAKRWAEGE